MGAGSWSAATTDGGTSSNPDPALVRKKQREAAAAGRASKREAAAAVLVKETWKEYLDANSLLPYFVNQTTGESRWTRPEGGVRTTD